MTLPGQDELVATSRWRLAVQASWPSYHIFFACTATNPHRGRGKCEAGGGKDDGRTRLTPFGARRAGAVVTAHTVTFSPPILLPFYIYQILSPSPRARTIQTSHLNFSLPPPNLFKPQTSILLVSSNLPSSLLLRLASTLPTPFPPHLSTFLHPP